MLGHEPTWRDQWRHFFAFASCTLDRIFLLSENASKASTSTFIGPKTVRALVARHPGCLLFVAHFGSAESLRVIGVNKRGLPLSILLDRNHGRMLTELLEQVNPQLARQRHRRIGTRTEARAEPEGGARGRPHGRHHGRPRARHRSLGRSRLPRRPARLPVGPWQLAQRIEGAGDPGLRLLSRRQSLRRALRAVRRIDHAAARESRRRDQATRAALREAARVLRASRAVQLVQLLRLLADDADLRIAIRARTACQSDAHERTRHLRHDAAAR